MKLHNIFIASAVALLTASCVNEDITPAENGDGAGALRVTVETMQPLKTRADQSYEVTNFPVTIYNPDGSKYESYEAVSQMPESIQLPVGKYTLEAHTPGIMERIMTTPYYKGTEVSEIVKDVTTQSTITCKMANTKVTVGYDQDFIDLFTSWTITFDDGTSNAITFTNEQGTTPPALYWDLGSGADKLTVNFRGVNKDGTVTASNTITKSQATESYDGESSKFTGGDAIVINFSPTEATTGEITIGISVQVFDTAAEEVQTVIQIVDNGNLKPDDGSGDDPTPGDDNAITLSLPAPITFTMGEGGTLDKSLGDVNIAATNGIKSLMVKAESSSEDMVASLEAVGAGYGLDFVGTGVEVVGNNDLVSFFAGLGQTLSVPTEGDTSYEFPIGNFFPLLDVMSGTHTFHLTAKDMNGNVKSGTVIVTVRE